jgi:hypothetical protein
MFQITHITDDPKQKQTLVLPDGSLIGLSIRFVEMQFGWFADLTHEDFVLNGLRITVSPNMLHQYRNLIPFGLMCASAQSREPSQKQDFSSGSAKLYVLDEDEVDQYASILSGETDG